MRKVHIDYESRSAVDIKKVGALKYAMHPSTEIICLSVAFDTGEPVVFSAAQLRALPPALMALAADDLVRFVAHSAHFEFAIWNYVMTRMGFPHVWNPTRWDCTLSRALVCGLPASLEKVALALNLNVQKDMAGRDALMKLCRAIGTDPLGGAIYNEDPLLLAQVLEYCRTDVKTEMAADAALPELTPDERKIWELDLVMNHRGVQLDTALARNADAMVGTITTRLNDSLHDLTGGAVTKASRIAEIKRYLVAEGLEGVDSLDKESVNDLLKRADVPANVKAVLNVRRQVGKTSTAKFATALDVACEDGRGRGLLQWHGAFTGRFAGRLLQPHNFPKGVSEEEQLAIIAAIMNGDAEFFSAIYGAKAMDALSNALRGLIVAPKGKVLVTADYNTIELGVEMWEAGDYAALEKLKRGEKPYVEMANFIYKRNDITKHGAFIEYTVGKAAVLGCGYQMGPERFVAACAAVGITITMDDAIKAVKAYRDKYPLVVKMWYATERAAIAAIKTPGTVQPAMGGKVLFGMSGDRRFLACRLPSGRFLRYYRPSIKVIEGPRGMKEEIHYWAPGLGGALEPQKTYGGSLVENITQAVARDILVNGMLKVEAAGFKMVLTVHDELVAEYPEELAFHGSNTMDKFIKLMCDVPIWATGCPVTAEGWIGRRYRK